AAAVFLQWRSSDVKDPAHREPIDDLKDIFALAQPQIVYIHNLADKHDTHVSVALRCIQALRELPPEQRPKELYGCEVWRDLDWMVDDDKVCFDVSSHENLQAALLGVFDSQVCGGKRYDLATLGRRRAHATYQETHEVDIATGMTFAMNLTPLIQDASIDPCEYVQQHIARFAEEVSERIRKFSG
ncbi:MAG: PIG-L family deacetylase, partial [Armatimonadetes bacterium]|nr:PIG-L family deacetylase [Armatimonadota bacterium]